MKCTMPQAIALTTLLAALLSVSGCSKENSIQPGNVSVTATGDAAESIAGAVAGNTGGILDQVGDIVSLASTAEYSGLAKVTSASDVESRKAIYDPVTGTWTVELERERSSADGSYYAMIKRTYTYQFLNTAGVPQEHWLTNGDTARTIIFHIIEAEGRHKTPRVSQELKTLEANLTATGCNTRIITINGSWGRAAVDTIRTERISRTHDHQLNVTLTDVTGPRGSREELLQKTSGIITGNYHALVTFTSKKAYQEKDISREFTIDLSNGEGSLRIDRHRFILDLFWGVVKNK